MITGVLAPIIGEPELAEHPTLLLETNAQLTEMFAI